MKISGRFWMKIVLLTCFLALLLGGQPAEARTNVPGLDVTFPKNTLETAQVLRDNPEYAIRCLAEEFKGHYDKSSDLAQAFWQVAFPGWKSGASMGAYGTKAQYVSRAYVFFQAFRAADGR
jgi:hypothetical protein